MLSSVRCEIALFSLILDAFRASGVWFVARTGSEGVTEDKHLEFGMGSD